MSPSIMMMSKLYAPTLKETPADAELISHKYLLRAGMIRKGAAGLYSYLPLAWRVILKIEEIIREEMEAIGCQEMLTPILTDAELWKESGRLNAYGPELMRIDDRHKREFCLGPTHEETFTALVRHELKSYKQLPLMLYHIQDKFRDELRPRFGLMRSREFIMKDAYSFAADKESSRACYELQKHAYERYCRRVGLNALPVVADTGEIGGDTSVEFMATAQAGEAELVFCPQCDFAADTEAAHVLCQLEEAQATSLEEISTPNISTIEELSSFLNISASLTRKAIALVDGKGEPWVVFLPGDHELEDCKARHSFGAFHIMSDQELELYGLLKGFIGPVNLPPALHIAADTSLKDSTYWLVGANKKDTHYKGAQLHKDFEVELWTDIIKAQAGDLCPVCNTPLEAARGIECGQVFLFDDKYSSPMGATFTDVDGEEKPLLMGSYGIGVSRTLAAIVEQHHDENGIIWPVSVAPYQLEIIALDSKGEVLECACALAEDFKASGLDVIVDDRKLRPGVKFAEADLLGFPYQIIIGKRGLQNHIYEVKCRADNTREDIAQDDIVSYISRKITDDLQKLNN